MSWKETLARWLGRGRGTTSEARPAREDRPQRAPPATLPWPAAATLTLLTPLGRFLGEHRRRLCGWGWAGIAPLPAWAGGRPEVPAPGRARTRWRGLPKIPLTPFGVRMQLPTAPWTAFARERLARYRYEVGEEGTPGAPAPGPERPFPVAWYGTLLGAPGTSVPPPDRLSFAPPGETFGAGEEAGRPGGGLQAAPGPGWKRENNRLPPRSERALSPGRAFQDTSGGSPRGNVAGPLAAHAASADVSGAPPSRSVGSRLRRFLAQLGRELFSGERPPALGPQDTQEAARRSIPGPAGMSFPAPSVPSEPPHPLYPEERRSPGGDAESVGTQATAARGPRGTFNLIGVPPEPAGAARGAPDEQRDRGTVPPSGFGLDAEDARAASERPRGRGTDARGSTREGRREEAPASPEGADHFARRLQARMGRGAPLPSPTRQFLETVLRRPLRGLRVHTGEEEARAVRKMGAAAATLGREILLSPDFPGLETPRGLELLAHEAVHAIQAVERGPAHEGAPEAREEEAEALRAQMAVRGHLQRTRLRVSVPPPPPPTFPELPVARAPGRGAEVLPPVTAVPSFGPFRRAPAEEAVTPAPPAPPAAEPSPAPDVEALAEEVYRRLRYRLELEREQRGIG